MIRSLSASSNRDVADRSTPRLHPDAAALQSADTIRPRDTGPARSPEAGGI